MSPRTAKVTVGVPIYNGERFVRSALDALLAQTFGDFVVRISDNGSTDGTRRICEEYARRDARIAYTRHDVNRGANWNFNELARTATTPLFSWYAVDDTAQPRYLESCVAALESTPQAVLAYTLANVTDERGALKVAQSPPLPFDSPVVAERFGACLSPIPYVENALYGVVRTAALHGTRLLGPFGGSDRAFLAELTLYGPFARVDERLFTRVQYAPVKSGSAIEEYNTGRRALVTLREWRILLWNLQSVRRAPLTSDVRRPLYGAIGRRLTTQRRLYATELAYALKALVSRS